MGETVNRFVDHNNFMDLELCFKFYTAKFLEVTIGISIIA